MSSSTLKSYTKGSKCPPNIPGKLRLYNMRFCPYAQRAKLVLVAKKIDFEEININLTEKPEWFFDKNPMGLVPAIELDDRLIGESLVICDYLDEVYSDHPLHPKDPFLKAKNSMLVARFNKVHSAMYKLILNKDGNAEDLWEAVQKEVEFVEQELVARGSKFLHGDRAGMVDYMIWPWFERLSVAYLLSGMAPLSPKRFPKLSAYIDDMWKDPTASQVAHPPENQKKYVDSKLNGKMPDYDLGL